MQYVVLGYPTISKTDFDWIQDLRKTNDRLYEVVKPHFTFVFPTDKLSAAELIDHVQLKSKDFQCITLSLTKAIVVEDDSKTFFHTFLVPSGGKQEITELHDLLYTDVLMSELRLDIPFVPHIGAGSNESKDVMQTLADSINNSGVDIKGSIDELTIASFDGKRVVDIERVALG